MKRLKIHILALLLLPATIAQAKDFQVIVQNPSGFDRSTELVEIPLHKLKGQTQLADTQTYIVHNSQGETVTSQVTSDGKLLFQSGLRPKARATFNISVGKKQEFPPKTYGRFIEERKDDFAWENDRVAFRVYGQALIPIDGPSNGLDIWYKRTNELIINKWYANDLAGIAPYHRDNGEGLDDYKVGRTLGAGAMAPYINDELVLNENFATFEILDNGPLRTTFRLNYKDLIINGKAVAESRTFSLDAGSQLTQITQRYDFRQPTKVAAGIVNRRVEDICLVDPDKGYLIYTEPFSKSVEQVYVALVFPDKFEKNLFDYSPKIANPHLLAVTTYRPYTPITYYAGYGWSKFGFRTSDEFLYYIENFKEALEKPLVVTIK
ncbi:DUF4861 domain-containing protein [Bacteroidia bacterium]|nr:DUF4861 domain-containing protein [Bacteroidia bacterium]